MGPETDARMPLTAHLEELRWRIVRALVAVGVGFSVCYAFSEHIFAFLLHPLAALRPSEALVIGTVVTHRHLIAWARYAIVVIFIVAAVLTPGPDVASQLLMAAPLLVLYGVSIVVALFAARPAPAAVPAEGTGQP